MKKTALIFAAGLVLLAAGGLYAANGNLIVNGKIGVGTTAPERSLQFNGSDGAGFGFEGYSAPPNSGALRFGDNTGWRFYIGRSRESAGGALNSGAGGAIMTIRDNGNVGIGADPGGAPLYVHRAVTNGYIPGRLFVNSPTVVTTSGSNYNIGLLNYQGDQTLSAGVTDNGYRVTLKNDTYVNNNGFAGTLATQYGLLSSAGMYNAASTGRINAVVGGMFYVYNGAGGQGGAIDNSYGVYIGSDANGTYGGNFGGKWDLYAASADARNYFAGKVGIGTADPGSYQLYVAGTAYATGSWLGSDARFKKNVQPITDPISKVLNLSGVSYEWKRDEDEVKVLPQGRPRGEIAREIEKILPDVANAASEGTKTAAHAKNRFPEGRHYGVIAQEIEKVLPEVVNTAPDGMKAVAYTEIIPVLIEAVKAQQKQIEALKSEIEGLKKTTLR